LGGKRKAFFFADIDCVKSDAAGSGNTGADIPGFDPHHGGTVGGIGPNPVDNGIRGQIIALGDVLEYTILLWRGTIDVRVGHFPNRCLVFGMLLRKGHQARVNLIGREAICCAQGIHGTNQVAG
jgi:hypothetical protein